DAHGERHPRRATDRRARLPDTASAAAPVGPPRRRVPVGATMPCRAHRPGQVGIPAEGTPGMPTGERTAARVPAVALLAADDDGRRSALTIAAIGPPRVRRPLAHAQQRGGYEQPLALVRRQRGAVTDQLAECACGHAKPPASGDHGRQPASGPTLWTG